eukprot:CAMPEP_0194777144 /NCGR_PEP_ID=MMETSP0323_2-20130528/64883_1 /TAXON_ID=2866 ORGANISM="Crypthecodinium cohnii, Strain Seligo" /NCGR_SAMPLE_ID=MMETSP0323_2 /ASSEMBLY_ACC=CAM_ASM_000346 /LENGTH=121 /DNA_ID=CAMNT_0039713835 /DNA_START=60 /DNA_END=425 /DNA_ORIENTATION=-
MFDAELILAAETTGACTTPASGLGCLANISFSSSSVLPFKASKKDPSAANLLIPSASLRICSPVFLASFLLCLLALLDAVASAECIIPASRLAWNASDSSFSSQSLSICASLSISVLLCFL